MAEKEKKPASTPEERKKARLIRESETKQRGAAIEGLQKDRGGFFGVNLPYSVTGDVGKFAEASKRAESILHAKNVAAAEKTIGEIRKYPEEFAPSSEKPAGPITPEKPAESGKEKLLGEKGTKTVAEATKTGKLLTPRDFPGSVDYTTGASSITLPEGKMSWNFNKEGPLGAPLDRLRRMKEGQANVRSDIAAGRLLTGPDEGGSVDAGAGGGLTTGAGGSGPEGTLTAQDFRDKARLVAESRMGIRAARGERQMLGPSMADIKIGKDRQKLINEYKGATQNIMDQVERGRMSSRKGARLLAGLDNRFGNVMGAMPKGEGGGGMVLPDPSQYESYDPAEDPEYMKSSLLEDRKDRRTAAEIAGRETVARLRSSKGGKGEAPAPLWGDTETIGGEGYIRMGDSGPVPIERYNEYQEAKRTRDPEVLKTFLGRYPEFEYAARAEGLM